uniref:Hirudin-like factor 1 short variant n=1 Tax=Hirudo verbana TaxID=311461 RepID=A0A1I9W206_9ANNE|nr:hirudin-like factor 1 short variant [Hirudo verbana]
MFSLKLFVVFLAVCICMSQEIDYEPCSENIMTPCLCGNNGNDLCSYGGTCQLNSNGNTCIGGSNDGESVDSVDSVDSDDDDDDDK